MRVLGGGILAVALGLPAAASDVAIVYSVAGHASLRRPAGARLRLRLFERLGPGAELRLAKGALARLVFLDGTAYELEAGAHARVGQNDLESHSGPVRRLPPIPPLASLPDLRPEARPGRRHGAIRIRTDRIGKLYPRDGVQPAAAAVLRFERLRDAARYQVEVQDAEGRVVHRVETEACEVPVPAEALEPGRRYHWTVETRGHVGRPASGSADFATLDRDAERRRAGLHAAVDATDADGLALLAVADCGLGLWAEARDALLRAARLAPRRRGLAGAAAALERLLASETGVSE